MQKKTPHSCAVSFLLMEPYCGNGGRGSSAVQPAALWKKLQFQFAGEFVDNVVGCALLGLDVHLAGLHADLVGGAVVCLGTVDDVGDVVLLTAHLHVQLGCPRRAGALADLRVLPSAAGASAAGAETFFSGMMHNLPSVFDHGAAGLHRRAPMDLS